MASTGTVYVLDSFKGRRGNVLVVGRAKFGNQAVLEAQSFNLKVLYGAQFTPTLGDRFTPIVPGSMGSTTTKRYDRTFSLVNGSLGSGGSLNNYMRVRSYFAQTAGTLSKTPNYKGTFGLYLGTKPGSQNFSFLAWGR